MWKPMIINMLCTLFAGIAAAVAWKHCQAYTPVSQTVICLSWTPLGLAFWSILLFHYRRGSCFRGASMSHWGTPLFFSFFLEIHYCHLCLNYVMSICHFSYHPALPFWRSLILPVLQWSASTPMLFLLEGIHLLRRQRLLLDLILMTFIEASHNCTISFSAGEYWTQKLC